MNLQQLMAACPGLILVKVGDPPAEPPTKEEDQPNEVPTTDP